MLFELALATERDAGTSRSWGQKALDVLAGRHEPLELQRRVEAWMSKRWPQ